MPSPWSMLPETAAQLAHVSAQCSPPQSSRQKQERNLNSCRRFSLWILELGVVQGVYFHNCLVMVVRAIYPSWGSQGNANVFIGEEFWWSEPVSATSHIPLKINNAYMDHSVFLCPTRVLLVLLHLFPCPRYTCFCTGWFFQLYFFF